MIYDGRVRTRTAFKGALLGLVLCGWAGPTPAAAPRSDGVPQILIKLQDESLVERTYGAIAAQHFARRQWGFSLFGQAELRPWQRALGPAVPRLVDLLAEDRGLEWVDDNGASEKVTTPRREATWALLALERASVERLVAALDRKEMQRKADELLRRIVHGGPAGHDRAAWQDWWSRHERQALPNERGQWWLVLLALVALSVVAALVFRRQRRGRPRMSALAASAAGPMKVS